MDSRVQEIHEGVMLDMLVENPFDMQKASHYTDVEVLNLWVDLTERQGGLVSLLEPKSLMPKYVLGGKGSGKTHLMRYCSSPVQAARHGSLIKAIGAEGYLGIYILADALNTHKFSGKGIPQETWNDLFAMYFETWMAMSFLSALSNAIGSKFDAPMPDMQIRQLRDLFSVDLDFRSLAELSDYLSSQKKAVEHSVNNASITRSVSDILIPFTSGALAFDLPRIVSAHHDELQSPTFLFLIDELENFTESQQMFINALIRYRRGETSIRIGARLYGIKTFSTFGSKEPIRLGAEYEVVRLDDLLRERSGDYEKFATDLIIQRLTSAKMVPSEFTSSDLHSQFSDVDRSDNWSKELRQLMERYDREERLRPHLAKLTKKLISHGVNEEITRQLVAELSQPHRPLLEKLNAFLFLRSWKGDPLDALPLAEGIRSECEAFIHEGKAKAQRYASVLSHFSSDLIAQLYRDAKKRVPYAGFRTFVDLSMGIPRNLLGIMGQIYKHSRFSGENPFAGSPISIQSQTAGVLDGARAFWVEAQPDEDAPHVKESIEALALVLRSMRFSDAPPECDLCTIAVESESLTAKARSNLKTATNWSHLVKLEDGHRNKNYDSIDDKYQLAPMLAPIWELSHHRRGVVELSPELANAVFDNTNRQQLVQLVEERIKNLNAPRRWGRSERQNSLF